VQESMLERVMNKLVARFGKMRFGNHMDKNNSYGPFSDPNDGQRLRETIEKQKKDYGAYVKQPCDSNSTDNNVAAPYVISNVGLNCPINLNEASYSLNLRIFFKYFVLIFLH
jgi:acyl-CoA reductase-like NAD-dependent aldehyde dehydrogenase